MYPVTSHSPPQLGIKVLRVVLARIYVNGEKKIACANITSDLAFSIDQGHLSFEQTKIVTFFPIGIIGIIKISTHVRRWTVCTVSNSCSRSTTDQSLSTVPAVT